MPTQFTGHGFQDWREYMQSNWNHVAVVDDQNNEVLRWEVPANSNTQWSSGPINNPLTAELTITGQDILDEGGSLPVTLARTETYKSATATARTSYDPFTDVDIQVQNDEAVIEHKYRTPP